MERPFGFFQDLCHFFCYRFVIRPLLPTDVSHCRQHEDHLLIKGPDGEAIEKVARYMSWAAISVERVEFNLDDKTVTVYEKQDRLPSCKQAIYTLLEFIALLEG